MTSHPPSSSPLQSNGKLNYNYLVFGVPLIVIIVFIVIVIAMSCCDWLWRQFLSVHDMLSHGHNVNIEMQRWIRAFKYQKNEPDVEGHEGEATPKCPICLSSFDEGEEKFHHLALKEDGGENDDEPDQDPMVLSSRAIKFPSLLSQKRTSTTRLGIEMVKDCSRMEERVVEWDDELGEYRRTELVGIDGPQTGRPDGLWLGSRMLAGCSGSRVGGVEQVRFRVRGR
ncbi:hypothetical protein MA16_Dca009628 [Dendrobium catenatum]|uniref:Uncharacterized protein n=1 Tax=Dendrobium catenatum TaxID=906689 RepID=A0A2I0VSK6_9ASPA|nr:hypothetical protein MA16_Dca009628 [Dendrobium catenatum]